jgi:hypothetical protein
MKRTVSRRGDVGELWNTWSLCIVTRWGSSSSDSFRGTSFRRRSGRFSCCYSDELAVSGTGSACQVWKPRSSPPRRCEMMCSGLRSCERGPTTSPACLRHGRRVSSGESTIKNSTGRSLSVRATMHNELTGILSICGGGARCGTRQ